MAGGVGLAALEHLSAAGAMVCGTAGSVAKRSLLRSQGVQHAASSRSTEFAETFSQVGCYTAHNAHKSGAKHFVFAAVCNRVYHINPQVIAMQVGGMDVVLNSLTSPGMMAASLVALASSGACIEISKRDIWSPARVAQERLDVKYCLLAIDFFPAYVSRLSLAALAKRLADGGVHPLPVVLHSMGSVHAALRQMSKVRFDQGGMWVHTGAIVCCPLMLLQSRILILLQHNLSPRSDGLMG